MSCRSIVAVSWSEKARVAVIHDWLYTFGGAERVLEQILAVFPNADVFSLFDVLPDDQRGFLGDRKVKTSFIQKLVKTNSNHRFLLPLMPLAIEQFDLSDYDLVISSSYAVAKGVITGPRQFHVSYVHSPMRYAWDLQHEYLRNSKLTSGVKAWMAKLLLHKMRLWDIRTSNSVDAYISNSHFVSQRIWKLYRRHAKVISPRSISTAFVLATVRVTSTSPLPDWFSTSGSTSSPKLSRRRRSAV